MQKKNAIISCLFPAAALVLTYVLYYFWKISDIQPPPDALLCACNATFVIGFIYLCWAFCRLLNVERIRPKRKPTRVMSRSTYKYADKENPVKEEPTPEEKAAKKKQRKKNSFIILITGAVLFIVSVILMLLR